MRSKIYTMAMLMALSTACSTGEAELSEADIAEVNSYIYGLGHLMVKDVQPKQEEECLDCPLEQQEEDYLCNYRKFTETAQYAEFIAFQPNSASLWPGSVIQGGSSRTSLPSSRFIFRARR